MSILIKLIRNKINLPLFFIILIYILIILKYSDYIPMWDAWEYVNTWIYKAISSPFNLFNFDAANHPSFVYLLLVSFLQYFNWGNQFLLYLSNAILMIISTRSFYLLIRFIYPDEKLKIESQLITLVYSFYPIILASIFHINLDYGMVIFFVITLSFIVRERWLWAALAGTGLVFSKEPGIIIYTLLIVVHRLLSMHIRFSLRYILSLMKIYPVLFIPIFLFLVRIVVKIVFLNDSPWWLVSDAVYKPTGSPYEPEIFRKIPLSYFVLIFILNFNWILTFFTCSGIINLIRSVKKRNMTKIHQINTKQLWYVLIIFLGTIVTLIQFKTFSNPRYFLPIFPLLIIFASYGIISLITNNFIRKAVLVGLVVIFFIANFRSFDPISKKIYGTFKFGDHEMLKMTSITGECCGYGRDQLVYNLQFTNIHFLLDKILSDIKPDEETAIAYTHWNGPFVIERLDKTSGKRTLRRDNSFAPNIVIWNFYSLPERPEIIYFIEFPNTDRRPNLDDWLYFYDIEREKIYERAGYIMKVYTLKIKK